MSTDLHTAHTKACPKAATGTAPMYCEQRWTTGPYQTWLGGPPGAAFVHQCGHSGGDHQGHQCACGAMLTGGPQR